MTAFGILWFVLIVVLMSGYFVLDGFDLGVGVLYPFLAKDEDDKRTLMRAIGPVWDGNEVWLLTAGGALFAAFAPAYATSFSGFYLAIMLVLFGLILRAVSVEYRAHETQGLKLWDAFFFIGSLLPALLFGVALGNVVQGLPLNANGDYTGTFFALLNPFALLCGAMGLAHMLLQGASWIALKSAESSELRNRAVSLRDKLAVVNIVLFALVLAVFFAVVVPGLSYALASVALIVVCALAYVGSLGAVKFACAKSDARKDLLAQVLVSVGAIAIVVLVTAVLFPNLIPALNPAFSLNIANSASSDTALGAMTIIACIGVPIMLAYHVIVYRVFRGRASK